jgi:ketosteroid isomerase-like protein
MRHSYLLFAFLVVSISLPLAAQKKSRPASRPAQPSATQQQQLDDDKEAIQKLHDEDIQASLALDVPALESLWTDDIVMMAPNGPAVVGREANSQKLEATAAAMKNVEIMAYDEQWQEIRTQGDWAYEWGTITGRTRPFSGNESSYKFNVMRVLNRQPDGSWKIARSIYNDALPLPTKQEAAKPEEPKKDRMKD